MAQPIRDDVVVGNATRLFDPARGTGRRALGAFVTGLDLTVRWPPSELAGCAPLLDHLVVFLPDQPMTLDDLERLTVSSAVRRDALRRAASRAVRYVISVIKEPDDELNFANAWHTDLSYLPVPPSYTLLHACDVPVTAATRSGPTSTSHWSTLVRIA